MDTSGGNASQRSKDCSPLALISFDEAHGLAISLEFSTRTRQQTPHYNLGKALAALDSKPVFFAFLSTSSRVVQLPPPPIAHPSAHFIRGSCLILPFMELPFNIFMDTH